MTRDLIRSWVDMKRWELKHVARNLALDCEGIDIEHPDLGRCGGRLKAEALAILDELIPRYTGRRLPVTVPAELNDEGWASVWGEIEGALEELAGNARQRLRPQESSDPQEDRRQGDVKVDLVRYVSCRSIYQYWRGGLSTDQEEVRGDIEAYFKKYEEMKRHSSHGDPLELKDEELGARGQPVWVADYSEAPHRREEIEGEPSAEKALAVARRMALPGFVTAYRRSRAVGLVAVSYGLNRRALRAPTALDGMQPYFFPGYREEDHGRVASLGPAFNAPWARNEENSGVREWLHDNRRAAEVAPDLELVGWF